MNTTIREPKWDVKTGVFIRILGHTFPIYRYNGDAPATGERLKKWRDTEWMCSTGRVAEPHDIVYINNDFRTYIRVPK